MKYSLLKLDVFRKMPKDLTEPTFCGAVGKKSICEIILSNIVSMMCTGLLILLCSTELEKYFRIETNT